MALKTADIVKIYPAASNDFFRIFDDEGKLLAIAEKEPQTMSFRPCMVFPASGSGS